MDTTDNNQTPKRRLEDQQQAAEINWDAPGAPAVPVPLLRAVASMSVSAEGISFFATPAAYRLEHGHYMLPAPGAEFRSAAVVKDLPARLLRDHDRGILHPHHAYQCPICQEAAGTVPHADTQPAAQQTATITNEQMAAVGAEHFMVFGRAANRRADLEAVLRDALAGQQAAPAEINANEQFIATLTASGAQIRNDYYAWVRRDLPEVAPALACEGDAITEPLWELMKCFGPKIYMGMPEVPFVGNKIVLAAAPTPPASPVAVEQEQAKAESELRTTIRQMATALNNGEWANLLTTDEDLSALDAEISELVSRANGAATPAASAPTVPEGWREQLYTAAINCGHSIDENKIVLHRDKRKEGNALSQLADRLAAAIPVAPAASADAVIELIQGAEDAVQDMREWMQTYGDSDGTLRVVEKVEDAIRALRTQAAGAEGAE